MSITVVGLGPSGLGLVDASTIERLTSAGVVIVRTAHHPAVGELATAVDTIDIVACDDLYEEHEHFDAVYEAIVDRVMSAAHGRDVVYAVPGSPAVGERTVPMLVDRANASGVEISVRPGTSFLDLAWIAVSVDPITDGAQIVDARDLPDPLPLHLPTLITQVDSTLRAGDVALALGRVLEDDAVVAVLDRLGDPDERVAWIPVSDLPRHEVGIRTSVFVPSATVGLLGLVATNRTLRTACPWDRDQTHHTLLEHLIEEAYEAADAIGRLSADAPAGTVDYGAYAEVEDELGDLLLQVVFHATLASEAGAFTIDDVAEQNRRKLVRRHPHVFGEVDATTSDQVRDNWERIKQDEKPRASLMDDIPAGMSALSRAVKAQRRAASVGFDWSGAEPVLDVLRSEIDELEAAGDDASISDELGDVLFSAVNLARHLHVNPESALRGSVERFSLRFRAVEAEFEARDAVIADAAPDELDAAWRRAKATTMAMRGRISGPATGQTP
jgi:tetrapyrrole methylase family protein/MazG family protein